MQLNTISANQDDVREEWEKVKLSYEILIDRKTRLKYDRNSVVADPGAAVGRAVGGAVGSVFSWGVEGVFRMVAGEKGGVDSVDGNGGGGNGSREAVETSK
jgi:DnaJ-class molecular chaperone